MRPRAFGLGMAFAVAAAAGRAHASGFLLYEQSAAAVAQGSAVAASTTAPDAVWFNPAGLAFAPAGPAANVNGALVLSRTSFSPAGAAPRVDAEPGTYVVPSVFGRLRLHERVQAGVGLYAPFGFAVTWPEGWVGAQSSLATRLSVLSATAAVGVVLHRTVSVGAGLSALHGRVTIRAAIPGTVIGSAPAPDAGVGDLTGDAFGVGAHAAVLWRPLPEKLHAALVWKTRAKFSFEGRADFTPVDPLVAEIFVDQSARADVTIPDVVTIGVMGRPTERLTLGLEANNVRWGVFDRLVIDFERPSTPDRIIERENRNPWTFRGGGAWSFDPTPLVVRAGVSFDQSAAAPRTLAPSAPDGNRLSLAGGGGFRFGRVTLDVAYLYAHFFDAEAAGGREGPAGRYRTRAHAFVLGLSIE